MHWPYLLLKLFRANRYCLSSSQIYSITTKITKTRNTSLLGQHLDKRFANKSDSQVSKWKNCWVRSSLESRLESPTADCPSASTPNRLFGRQILRLCFDSNWILGTLRLFIGIFIGYTFFKVETPISQRFCVQSFETKLCLNFFTALREA